MRPGQPQPERLAEALGVSVGDTVTLRDSDMNTLTVTVSGIEGIGLVGAKTVEVPGATNQDLDRKSVV